MKEFLIYVLAAFLLTWEKELKHMDFQVRHLHSVQFNDMSSLLAAGVFYPAKNKNNIIT